MPNIREALRLQKVGCTLTGHTKRGRCAEWRVFVHFCVFLLFVVRFCAFSYKIGLQKRVELAQNPAKMCKKTLLCNTPFS